MGLVKRTYVDQETVITAENLNAIQDAIIENEEAIEDQGEAIEGKYSKPAGGIPATDMATGVQTSLGKADSAYQKPSGGIPATDMASGVQTSLGNADSAYQKPSGGIPSTDLASAVQTSLGKADTALQSSDIDNTLTVSGKAADAKITGDEISDVKNTLSQLESGLAIIVNGDTCTTAVPVGGYAYIKNNTHGLSEGLYTNTSASAFPISGGTANSSVFTAVSGGLNTLNNKIDNYVKAVNKTINTGQFGESVISDSSITYILGGKVPSKGNWHIRPYGDKKIQILDITDGSLKASQTNLEVILFCV